MFWGRGSAVPGFSSRLGMALGLLFRIRVALTRYFKGYYKGRLKTLLAADTGAYCSDAAENHSQDSRRQF